MVFARSVSHRTVMTTPDASQSTEDQFMFDHLVEAGLPAGPFAAPVPMYRVGRGKLHVSPHCRPNARLVDVVLWTTSYRQLCEECVLRVDLPHYDLWAARHVLNQELAGLRDPSTTTALGVEATYLPKAFWSKLHTVIRLKDEVDSDARLTRFDDELELWRQSVFLPKAREALAVLLDEFAAFSSADWPLRFAAIKPFEFGHLPSKHIAGPTPGRALAPSKADHQLVAELRNGLLHLWFTTVEVPSHDELAAAARAAVTQKWQSTYTSESAACDMACTLLDSYKTATARGDVVFEWRLSPATKFTSPELPPGLRSLLLSSRLQQPTEDGFIVVTPRAVVDALPDLTDLTDLKRGGLDRHVPRWSGAIYGPSTTEDTDAVLVAAAALRRGGMPHREALEMSRLAAVTLEV